MSHSKDECHWENSKDYILPRLDKIEEKIDRIDEKLDALRIDDVRQSAEVEKLSLKLGLLVLAISSGGGVAGGALMKWLPSLFS